MYPDRRNSRHQHQIVPRRPHEVSPLGSLPVGLEGVRYSNEQIPNIPTGTGNDDSAFVSNTHTKEIFFITVAAFDAPDEWKRGADYVCDGVDDQNEIYDAIYHVQGYNANTGQNLNMWLPQETDPANTTSGEYEWYNYIGGVLLSPGRFICSSSIYVDVPYFSGSGPSTVIVWDDNASQKGMYWDVNDYPGYKPVLRDFSLNMYNHMNTYGIYNYGSRDDTRGMMENITVYGGKVGFYTGEYTDLHNCHAIKSEIGIEVYQYCTVTQCTTYDCWIGAYNYGFASSISDSMFTCWFPEDLSGQSFYDGPIGVITDGNFNGGLFDSYVIMNTSLTNSTAIFTYGSSIIEGVKIEGGNATVGDPGDFINNKGIVIRNGQYQNRNDTYDVIIRDCFINFFGGYSVYFDPDIYSSPGAHVWSGRAIITGNYFWDSSIGGIVESGGLVILTNNIINGYNWTQNANLRKYFIEVDGGLIDEHNNIFQPGANYLGLIKRNMPNSKPTLKPSILSSDIAFRDSEHGAISIDSETGAAYRTLSESNTLKIQPAPPSPPEFVNFVTGSGSSMSIAGPELVKGDTLVLFVMTRFNAPTGLPSGSGWEQILQVPFNGNRFTIYKKVVEATGSAQTYTLTNSGNSAWGMSISKIQGLGDIYDYDFVAHETTNIAPAVNTVKDGALMRFWGFYSSTFKGYGGGWKREGPQGEVFIASNAGTTYSTYYGTFATGTHDGVAPALELNNRTDAFAVNSNNFSLSIAFRPKGTTRSVPTGTADGTYENTGLYLISPNGTRFLLGVDNNGNLTTSVSSGAVSMRGTAKMIVEESVEVSSSVSMSGTAAMTATGRQLHEGQVSMTGRAGFVKTGSTSMAGSATMTADGTVS